MSEFTLSNPVLTTYEWNDRPSLGTSATTNPSNSNQTTPGQEITLGGFSGLYYEGKAVNGNLKFITNTDRGPNGEPTDLIPSIPGSERPFALPNFQPELVRFELDRTTGQITITERIGLKRPDGTALTGLPNLQSGAAGTAYTDEVAIDLFGNRLANDALGADLEGIVVAADGTFWMVDEYRPAIYHFDGIGQLIDRFIPKGTPTGGGEFGTAALPEVYAQRRNNRGFEAVALEGTKLYTFIQSAIDNPDSAADTTSRGSQNLRILEFDVTTQSVTGEYLYRLDDISGSSTARTDKLGDAVALGDGKFLVVERDDRGGSDANKLIYEIDLKGATNINNAANLTNIPVGKTIEQLGTTELQDANLQAVSKRLVANAATLGYTGVEKLEGLAVTDSGAIVLLNDNDFGLQANPAKGDGTVSLNEEPTPVKLGIIESESDMLPGKAIAQPTLQGEVIFPTGFVPNGAAGTVNGVSTPVGGLSGVTYDAANQQYYAISDDRSQIAPARFYTFTADLSATPTINFTNVTPLKDSQGNFFALNSLDSEGIALTANGTVFISSEGEANPSTGRVTAPFIKEFSLATGQEVRSLPIPSKFLPIIEDTNGSGTVDVGDLQKSGVRNNLAFESLTLSPNQKMLYTATENALFQDGATTTRTDGSRSRILQYNLGTGQPEKEYLYVTDAIAADPVPATGAKDNGLVDLLAIDNRGTLLALERSFAQGVGNTIKIYQVSLQGTTDISTIDSLSSLSAEQFAAIQPAQKQLLLNLDMLKLPTGTDNIEGITWGPKLADGRQSIVLVSDNNFSATQFTQVLALGADLLAIDTSLNSGDLNPGNLQPTTLPNQVASGDTTQNSTVLWTRSEVSGAVKFEYSTHSDFSQIAGTQTVIVSNPLQPVKIQVDGLTPNTPYYYRATDAAGATGVGQFNTAAEAGTHTGLRFGAAGDWRGELSPYPAIANADQQNLDFFISLGDTIYADFPSPALNKPQAETLEEYRLKHNEVYSQRNGLNTWGDLRSSTSILAVIDDHEVINDFAGGALASSDPRLKDSTPGKLVNDTALYNNGLQSFQEYNPIRDELYGETGDARTTGERKLYRYNTYGNDAASFVLDARSFRDEELEGVTNPADASQVTNFLVQSYNPDRTLLGKQQVADLKQDLLNAEQQGITWKYIVVPEPIQNLGIVAASDRFEGYAAERTEILKFINDNDISNVVFISADIHSTLVNNLTYQTAPGQAQIATSAFEITTGSVGFDAPFGSTVAELASGLGLLSAEQKAFYDQLPTTNDTDSLLNDKDDFIKQLVNSQFAPFGYDPLGLNDNLAVADGKINAKLLQGDYLSTQTYAWTQFDIDPLTQKLTVTTYGIPYYTEAELKANPSEIADRTPTVVSQFEVQPAILGDAKDNELTGTDGTDEIKGLGGKDTLLGLGGNDKLSGGEGDDLLRGETGNNTLQGGQGHDRFVIGEGSDIIADFNAMEDCIALINISFSQLTFTQGTGNNAKDTLIQLAGSNNLLGIVKGVEASTLTPAVFTTV